MGLHQLQENSEAITDFKSYELATQLEQKIENLKVFIESLQGNATVEEKQELMIELQDAKQFQLKTKVQAVLGAAAKVFTGASSLIPIVNLVRSQKRNYEQVTSWQVLLVSTLNCAVWTSYSFKLHCIELAVVTVSMLLANVVMLGFYMIMRPSSKQIVQFFALIILCQIFNFDVLPPHTCGIVGVLCSLLFNFLPLSNVPTLIDTRVPNCLPSNSMLTLQIFGAVCWSGWALLSHHYLFLIAQVPTISSLVIQLLFVLWCKNKLPNNNFIQA